MTNAGWKVHVPELMLNLVDPMEQQIKSNHEKPHGDGPFSIEINHRHGQHRLCVACILKTSIKSSLGISKRGT